MKKILLLLLILLLFSPICFADEQKEIQFIYINGSNNNDKKMTKWFFDGVEKMHPNMLKTFNSSDFMKSIFLESGKYKIAEQPETFFWGDRSNKEIQTLNSELRFTQMFSPRLAQTVRTLLAHCLHDAIWVSHYRNMHPVIEDLHKQVMNNYENNKSVVLLGYSAGAFVTYEYLFNKAKSIDVIDYLSQAEVSPEFLNFAIENKQDKTCIDALIDSGVAVYSADGKLVPINNKNSRDAYLKLNDYTCKSCIPEDSLKGVINFGSPLVLFYSDISNPNYPLTYYNKNLYKYILEHQFFCLTVNYADDPLGYPTNKNVSYKDIKDKIKMEINPNDGFLYSKSSAKSRRTFIGAHTSYWETSKKFSKAVVEAYKEGYILYSDNEL